MINKTIAQLFNSIVADSPVVEAMRTKFISAKETHDRYLGLLEEVILEHGYADAFDVDIELGLEVQVPDLDEIADYVDAKMNQYTLPYDATILTELGSVKYREVLIATVQQCYTDDVQPIAVALDDQVNSMDLDALLLNVKEAAKINEISIYLVDAIQNVEQGIDVSRSELLEIAKDETGEISDNLKSYVDYIYRNTSHAPRDPRGVLSWFRTLINGHGEQVAQSGSYYDDLFSVNRQDYDGVSPLNGLLAGIRLPNLQWNSVVEAVKSVTTTVVAGLNLLAKGVSIAFNYVKQSVNELVFDPRDVQINPNHNIEAFDIPFASITLDNPESVGQYVRNQTAGWTGNPYWAEDFLEDAEKLSSISGVWHFPSQYTESFLVIPEEGDYSAIRAYFFITPGRGTTYHHLEAGDHDLNLPFSFISEVRPTNSASYNNFALRRSMTGINASSVRVDQGFVRGIIDDSDLEIYSKARQGFLAMQFYWSELIAIHPNALGLHSDFNSSASPNGIWRGQAANPNLDSCGVYFIHEGAYSNTHAWFNFPIGGYLAGTYHVTNPNAAAWNREVFMDWFEPGQSGRDSITNSMFLRMISPGDDQGLVHPYALYMMLLAAMLTDHDLSTSVLSASLPLSTTPWAEVMKTILAMPLYRYRYEMRFKYSLKTTTQNIAALKSVLLSMAVTITLAVVTVGFFKFRKNLKIKRATMDAKFRQVQNELASLDPKSSEYADTVTKYKKLLKAEKKLNMMSKALGVKLPIKDLSSGLDLSSLKANVDFDEVTNLIV